VVKIVTESQAWDMIKARYMDIDKDNLVEIIVEYMQTYGDGTGRFTLLGLANELESEYDDEFKVVADSDAAHILYDDKK
jgi:hypothetical protein